MDVMLVMLEPWVPPPLSTARPRILITNASPMMSPNNDDPRRDSDRPETNPFIAFRHFADSQASSLLNTVLTLPATLAKYHDNAHQARMQCLFRRADAKTCEELADIENKIQQNQIDTRERIRKGDLHAVFSMGEELMRLEEEAEPLRRKVNEQAGGMASDVSSSVASNPEQKDVVEQVANKKGQEWGWSWDWGFPRPFDAADNQQSEEEEGHHRRGCRRRWRERHEERRRQALEHWNKHFEQEAQNIEEEWKHFSSKSDEIRRRIEEEIDRAQEGGPKVWSWSFQWPPVDPNNQAQNNTAENEREVVPKELSSSVPPGHRVSPFTSHNYSPQALEDSEELRKAGIEWRDALEDLMRAQAGAPLLPEEKLGESSKLPYNIWRQRALNDRFTSPQKREQYPKRVPWEDEEPNEEPSYEYSHDHEDQHDEPPTPKPKQGKFDDVAPATELDAYERFLGPSTSVPAQGNGDARPSILSTLTTTERTVAPDGSITTKVVLKKRFADGREESSETVHTQRGQDEDTSVQDPWQAMQNAQFNAPPSNANEQQTAKQPEKKSGWFWSS